MSLVHYFPEYDIVILPIQCSRASLLISSLLKNVKRRDLTSVEPWLIPKVIPLATLYCTPAGDLRFSCRLHDTFETNLEPCLF